MVSKFTQNNVYPDNCCFTVFSILLAEYSENLSEQANNFAEGIASIRSLWSYRLSFWLHPSAKDIILHPFVKIRNEVGGLSVTMYIPFFKRVNKPLFVYRSRSFCAAVSERSVALLNSETVKMVISIFAILFMISIHFISFHFISFHLSYIYGWLLK